MDEDWQTMTKIVRDLFDEYHGPVTAELSARDVGQWSSLLNIQFMVMIEQAFNVRFSSYEVGQLKNVGELMAAIRKRRAMK